MWRGRNKRDSGDGITRLGNDLVHLEAGQLSAFTRLCALRHLYLQLFGVDKIFGCNAETTRSNLLCLAAKRHAVHRCVVAGVVLATLTRIAACSETVHRQGKSLMSLDAERSERHGTRNEVAYDALHRLHFVERCRRCSLLEGEQIAKEDGALALCGVSRSGMGVNDCCPLLKLLIAAQACGKLQLRDGFRVPRMFYAVLSITEKTVVRQEILLLCLHNRRREESSLIKLRVFSRDILQSDTADGAKLRAEVFSEQSL